jgi:hypothetical protein
MKLFLMNGEYVRIWKKVIVSYLKILSLHSCGKIRKPRETSVVMAGNSVKIRSRYLTNTCLERYHYISLLCGIDNLENVLKPVLGNRLHRCGLD